ncbi:MULTISPECIES: SIMPL domain-containing protein [Haloferax]|uniref:DUF541 domain-containing protein n=1 Tax=Haloferax marinum TaxID=2666143 RepID=A0A6A8GB39_9EURY|nr:MULTISPECIES: SIMPL domain-containing protein [Haloferax]KAB1190765.1 DUF541 domain-containing protein [Haloferax sp. CBA1150]MRW98304.1 DUF541 domain-containing protein [Haloferax marinum]
MQEGTVTTTATGRVRAKPENARISVRMRSEADSATEARDDVTDQSASVIDALLTSGLDESSIRQVNVQVKDNRGAFDEPLEYDYEAKETFVVRCDLEKASDTVVTLVDAGAYVEFVEYGFSEERRERLKSRALGDAMDKSRSRADSIAQAADCELGAVRSVTTEEVDTTSSGMQDIVEESLGFDSSRELDPGRIVVTAGVRARYQLQSTADD